MRKKILLSILYILLNIGIVIGIGLLDANIKKPVADDFASLQFIWLVAILACIALSLALDTLGFHLMIAYVCGKKPKFMRTVRVMLIGRFYNGLTPSSSGGQPFQIYDMMKWGASAGQASSILTAKFMAYSFAMTFLGIVAFALGVGPSLLVAPWLPPFAAVGMLISLGIPVFLYFFATSGSIMHNVSLKIAVVLQKLPFIKKRDWAERAKVFAADFQKSIYMFRQKPLYFSKVVFINILELVVWALVPYCVCLAFGAPVKLSVIEVSATYMLLQLAVFYFPTPGAGGATEGAFYALFSAFVSSKVIYASMILWRFSTYYLILVAGAIMIAVIGALKTRKGDTERTVEVADVNETQKIESPFFNESH